MLPSIAHEDDIDGRDINGSAATSSPRTPHVVPSSASSASPSQGDSSPHTTQTAYQHHHQSQGPPQSHADSQPRPKQKRNKPTLSCKECVDRKTKCDRGRPTCEACVKRGSYCRYSEIADILHNNPEKASKSRKTAKLKHEGSQHTESPPSQQLQAVDRVSIASLTNPEAISPHPLHPGHAQDPNRPGIPPPGSTLALSIPKPYQWQPSNPQHLRSPPPNVPHTPIALSSLSLANSAPISIFGIGIRHPFANYWTATGGLAEVVGVLPTKEQADILVAKYFELLDPLYPVLDREDFIAGYDHFWSLPHWERCETDAALLALHLVVYASSTQFFELAFPQEQQKTAEFYISAAHQALRISSYWNHVTMPTVQAMALTFYFLVNDNHAPDAYTHTGMTVRQAYVLQLNRDPEVTDPSLSLAEKSLRLRTWQAVMHQDVAFTQFLKLPPSATHTDITPECFDRYADAELEQERKGIFTLPRSMGDGTIPDEVSRKRTDLMFSKSLYMFTQFILDNICSRRALSLPICTSPAHKAHLISQFRHVYAALPKPFGSYDPKRFQSADKRLVRQQISIANNYFHSMMLVYVDENPSAGVTMDIWGTLDAAHESLLAFFAMREQFGSETDGFWAYQHRAFEVAITLANILTAEKRPQPPSNMGNNLSQSHLILRTAKQDVARLLQIMTESRGYFIYQTVPERRYDVLKKVYDRITMV